MSTLEDLRPRIDAVRARVPPSSVIGKHVELRRDGRELKGLCPFHNERTPSFYVNDSKAFFHCFGCGAHGDVLDFVRRHLGGALVEVLEDLENDAGLQAASTRQTGLKDNPVCTGKRWPPETAAEWRRTVEFDDRLAPYLGLRGCNCPGGDIRYMPSRWHWRAKRAWPALVCRISDFLTREPMSLHFIWLSDDRRSKAPTDPPKMSLTGHQMKGGVVRLCDDADIAAGCRALAVVEGCETGLSIVRALGVTVCWRPIVAALTAGNLGDLPVLPDVDDLLVYADAGTAGQSNARKLAARWHAAGRRVAICTPPRGDWNDYTEAAA